MIEDKFGAELLGFQLPVSSRGLLLPLQAGGPLPPSACVCSKLPSLCFSLSLSALASGEPGQTPGPQRCGCGPHVAGLALSFLGPGPCALTCPVPPTPPSHTSPPLPSSPASDPAEALSSSPKLEPPPSPHSNRKKHRRKKSTGTPRPDGPSSAAEG